MSVTFDTEDERRTSEIFTREIDSVFILKKDNRLEQQG